MCAGEKWYRGGMWPVSTDKSYWEFCSKDAEREVIYKGE